MANHNKGDSSSKSGGEHNGSTGRDQHSNEFRDYDFRKMADNLPSVVWITNLDGACSYLNTAWFEMTGQTPEHALGFGWLDAVHPDDKESSGRIFLEANERQTPFSLLYRLRQKNGEYHWAIDQGSPRYDDQHRFAGFIGSVVKVHEQKLAEQALRESEERFQAAVHAVEGVLWTNDATGKMKGHQKGWEDLTGQTLEEYQGYGWSKAVHPDDVQASIDSWEEAVREKKTYVHEHRLKTRTGDYRTFSIRAIPVYSNDGSIREWVGVHTDITKQRVAEAALAESEERFRTMADNIPNLAWMAEADGRAFWYNRKWYDYTGTTPPRMEGSGWEAVHDAEFLPAVHAKWTESLRSGEPFEMIFPIRASDGTFRPFLTRVLPVRGENNKILRWFGTATDVTSQKQEEEKLERLVRERTSQLEASNQDLLQFAHVASHDLKEPLRKIQTFLDRLHMEITDSLSEKGKTYIQKINNASERMGNMISGVLQYSQFNAEEQETVAVDLNMVIQHIENDLEVLIHHTGAQIIYRDLPIIDGAEVLLHQLFYNLINNSIKFGKKSVPPVIEISYSHARLGDEDCIRIELRDNGIGFDQSFAEKIFDTFTRLHSREKYEGTGLGLALCKRIVARHRGTIAAHAEMNAGATFIVTLPIRQYEGKI